MLQVHVVYGSWSLVMLSCLCTPVSAACVMTKHHMFTCRHGVHTSVACGTEAVHGKLLCTL